MFCSWILALGVPILGAVDRYLVLVAGYRLRVRVFECFSGRGSVRGKPERAWALMGQLIEIQANDSLGGHKLNFLRYARQTDQSCKPPLLAPAAACQEITST